MIASPKKEFSWKLIVTSDAVSYVHETRELRSPAPDISGGKTAERLLPRSVLLL